LNIRILVHYGLITKCEQIQVNTLIFNKSLVKVNDPVIRLKMTGISKC